MANAVTVQTLLDGPRNTVIKVVGVLDTSDQALMTLVDPALLCGIDNTGLVKAKHLIINRVVLNIEDALAVYLWWDATADVLIDQFTGRGHQEFQKVGGLWDNSGAGSTGKILLSTQGWTAGTLSFSLELELVKQQT